ncbi:MAG TPA: histidinol-phosphate transaminase [Cyclobacteriaceae bacterium]|nr:histidinol-phosphate transaminase [Cyclobacteriaceae bacterium]
MKTTLSRRDWFKSSFTLGAGLALTPALVNELMAAPVSRAERLHGIYPELRDGTVRLGSNENPYGPSPMARKAIQERITMGNRYVYDESAELKKLIAAKEGVAPENIMLGCGSSEILCLAGLGVQLEGGAVLSAYPVFRLLMDYAVKFNARWDQVDLDDKLVHDLDKLAAAVKPDTKLVFVVNPNNPTGTLVDPQKLKNFCVEVSKKSTVFVDEAYIEFLEPGQQNSMVELVKAGNNVIVSRTFSKVYGLAGSRVGYAIAHPDLIRKMTKYQMWGTMNQFGVAAAKATLADEDFVKMTRKRNAEAREHLNKYLDSKKWFYGKSVANVVLFPAPKSGKQILEETEKKGFQIRVWDYQGKEWCRVSIGTLEEMKGFTKAFDEVIS